MNSRTTPLLASLLIAAVVVLSFHPLALAETSQEDYQLLVSVDDTKVGFVSGNFTVAITLDWPRMIFWHTNDPFAPTFEVGFPKIHLYNETSGDSFYERAEALFTAPLDSSYVSWNLTPIDHRFDPLLGEFAQFGMTGLVSLIDSFGNESVVVPGWAFTTVWFSIAERTASYSNSLGEYTVGGKTSLRVNMTIEVRKHLDVDGLCVEQYLQGGGTTDTFLLTELVDREVNITSVSARVDERDLGLDFAHQFRQTEEPQQEIRFSKEDGEVQAFYFWDSVSSVRNATASWGSARFSSYITTGAGMTLHTTTPCEENLTSVAFASTVGIDEAGFTERIRDWAKEHLIGISAGVSALVAVVVLAVWFSRRKSRPGRKRAVAASEEKGD